MKHMKAITKAPKRADIFDVIDIQFLIDLLAAIVTKKTPSIQL